jgi:hypothetical protein
MTVKMVWCARTARAVVSATKAIDGSSTAVLCTAVFLFHAYHAWHLRRSDHLHIAELAEALATDFSQPKSVERASLT